MTKPDGVARDLVQAAFELHRRRLWLEVPGDAPFLIRVSDSEPPLVASIMGHAGQDYGLFLARGERAFDHVVRGVADGSFEPEDMDGLSTLSVTVEPLGGIDPTVRGLVEAAHFQCRRESLAPLALSKSPHRAPRSANRSEMRLILACVRTVLAAHDAGEFRPGSVNAKRRRILELALDGEGRDARATTRVVPWPAPCAAVAPPPGARLGPIDRSLPRLDERWLATTLLVPVQVGEDDRNTHLFVVVDESSGKILAVQVAPAGDLEPVARRLDEAFRGDGPPGRAGLPREIVFAREELLAAFGDDLRAAGVRASYERDPAGLEEAVAALTGQLEHLVDAESGDVRIPEEMPRTLEEWKAADRAVTARLLQAVADGAVAGPRAFKRYFGSLEVMGEVMDELSGLNPFPAFVEWFLADYRATVRSPTFLERRLRDERLPAVERALIEARIAAALSIYRVDSTVPGATLNVEDVFTGERTTIHDRALSGCGVDGHYVPLRVFRAGDWRFCAFAGPAIPPLQVDRAIEILERSCTVHQPGALRRSAHVLGRLWELPLSRSNRPPTLCNTDGDLLEWHTATFLVADSRALAQALDGRADVERDEENGEWVWFKPGGPAPGVGEITVLGRLQILDRRLVLEVNSAGRLARARRWIEALPGVTFERATQRELARENLPLDDRLPSPKMPTSPEMIEQLKKMHLEGCRRWLDERVPALGNMTPRAACATPEGRRRVTTLIRTMPPMGIPGGSLPAPREALMRELGLDARA